MKMIERRNDEVEAVMYECPRCHGLEDTPDDHVCQDLRERNERRKRVWDAMMQGGTKAIDDWIRFEQDEYKADIASMEHAFPESVYRQIVKQRLEEVLESVRNMREKIYREVDLMRRRGVSVSDWKQVLEDNKDKIAYCDKEESKLMAAMKGFELVPYREWIGEGETETIRRIGFTRFVRTFGVDMERCYKVIN